MFQAFFRGASAPSEIHFVVANKSIQKEHDILDQNDGCQPRRNKRQHVKYEVTDL